MGWGQTSSPVYFLIIIFNINPRGDFIVIPKGKSLLLDQNTPVLKSIVIEGALYLDHTKDLTLDAEYIFINGGKMHSSTTTNKHIITLHGTKQSRQLPIFGNKVIAVHNGILQLKGREIETTWTVLDSTAEVGANQITLIKSVDW